MGFTTSRSMQLTFRSLRIRKVAGPQLDVPLGTSKEQLGTSLCSSWRLCFLGGRQKAFKQSFLETMVNKVLIMFNDA